LAPTLSLIGLGCCGLAAGFAWSFLHGGRAPDAGTPAPQSAGNIAADLPSTQQPVEPHVIYPDRAGAPAAAEPAEPADLSEIPVEAETEAFPEDASPDDVPPQPDLAREAQLAQEYQHTTEFFRDVMQRGRDDRTWSETASAALTRHFAEHQAQGYWVGDVRCRADLCSISVTEAEPGSSNQMLMDLSGLEQFQDSQGTAIPSWSGNGTTSMTLFITRSGRQLPNEG
jgi:hypothetical protein